MNGIPEPVMSGSDIFNTFRRRKEKKKNVQTFSHVLSETVKADFTTTPLYVAYWF